MILCRFHQRRRHEPAPPSRSVAVLRLVPRPLTPNRQISYKNLAFAWAGEMLYPVWSLPRTAQRQLETQHQDTSHQ